MKALEYMDIVVTDRIQWMRNYLRSVLSKEKGFKIVGECGDGQSAVELVEKLRPRVVILDADLPLIDGIKAAEIIKGSFPDTGIILTCIKGGRFDSARAEKAGVKAFITKPFDDDRFIETVKSLRPGKNNTASNSNDLKEKVKPGIITVFAAKGGVGKTIIASNLAVAIADITKEEVALLDFDFQFGDVSIMLNLYPKKTIYELVSETRDFSEEIINEYMITHLSGIRVLPAPLSPEQSDVITMNHIQLILKTIMQSFKYIIIDTSPVFSDINLVSMDFSYKVIYTITQELSTIKNAKTGLQIMRNLKYDEDKICVVLNKYNKKFGISRSDIEKTLGRDIDYVIPENTVSAIQAMISGRPIMLDGSSNIAQSIGRIAEGIVINKKESKQTLIKRIFSG